MDPTTKSDPASLNGQTLLNGHATSLPRPVPEVPIVKLVHDGDYRFVVNFGDTSIPAILTDEAPPLGDEAGPTPVMLLAAAVGNCLASSLRFCMSKARLSLEGLRVEVATKLIRNEQGRLRVDRLEVKMVPYVTSDVQRRIGPCLEVFDTYCMVTESVRRGIRVAVDVIPCPVPDTITHGAA